MGAVARVEVMLDERRVPTEGILMAQIMVVADDARDLKQIASAMRERVTVADLESKHFGRQLLERVGWESRTRRSNVRASSDRPLLVLPAPARRCAVDRRGDRTGLTDEGPPDRFRSETDVDETPQRPFLGMLRAG
jgi:hypothetical protein